MASAARGEAGIVVDGRRRRLRLTLGGLAELEATIGAGGLASLAERFEGGAFSTSDLIALLGAGLRGGGWDVSDAELSRLDVEGGAAGAARSGARLLAATFAPLDPE